MNPLKILLGNNTLSLLAGSETWTYTLALQLKAMGHKVSCFAGELGIISDKLSLAGIRSFKEMSSSNVKPFSIVLEEEVDYNYDVIISNHHHIVEYLRRQFPKTPIISTIHGIIHVVGDKEIAPEHPALSSGVNQFISVSEEIQQKLRNDYNVDSLIVRNFFDLKKFSFIEAPALKPRQFLINTNYNSKDDKEIKAIRDAAKIMGVKVAAVGMNFSQSFDLDGILKESDVVFGMGRSVLEGVAAGRLGIVHGRWGTGGVICESNIEAIRYCNFSGRNSSNGYVSSPQEIVEMVEKYYQPQFLSWGKDYIAREHNVIFAAERYVQLARELLGQGVASPISNLAVDPAARPFKLASNA